MEIQLNILILSFYYEPDLSAGSFRTTALVRALLQTMPNEIQIDVITTMPNRYSRFFSKVAKLETLDRLTIRRISLPAHRSGMFDQSKAFFVYGISVLRYARGTKYDLIYATSSRLMTAVLGSVVARWKRAPLYLDIRDIFVDTIGDVLSKRAIAVVKPIFVALEKVSLRRARRVNLVSEGFLDYFRERYPQLTYSLFSNGVDPEFMSGFDGAGDTVSGLSGKPIVVLYAGNMGEGQGLHAIIPKLAEKMGDRIRFRLIGDGGRRSMLDRTIRASGVRNVELIDPVSRLRLIEEYRTADVLFLHLNDYDAFKKVLPSKIFEYAATGKPIWAGVAGFAERFLRREVRNAAVFEPGNVNDAVTAFGTLELAFVSRREFVARYSREAISRDMADDILDSLYEGM